MHIFIDQGIGSSTPMSQLMMLPPVFWDVQNLLIFVSFISTQSYFLSTDMRKISSRERGERYIVCRILCMSWHSSVTGTKSLPWIKKINACHLCGSSRSVFENSAKGVIVWCILGFHNQRLYFWGIDSVMRPKAFPFTSNPAQEQTCMRFPIHFLLGNR